MNWITKPFDELTPLELYKIIQLRNEVFVVEQNCVFQDADDKDQKCYHLMGWNEDRLAAYTRLVPVGVSYPNYISIGRVITNPKDRRSGFGKELMRVSIDKCYELWGKAPIKIGAQLYLKNFYESFGFQQISDVYDEDGIDHIEMLL
ncbi:MULTISPECIES: GNAT family N-acetyltransferase [unclassified Paraflavitalea]|uniref:GNAT family N-acetyltransferase n=1 Tax=unclassified Paraflavitalea TaxID=2798305 RepID=UPI003D357C0B